MTTQDHTLFTSVDNKKRFLWLVEQERFRNNIETLHRISEELAAKREELNRLLSETQSIKAETRSLQIMLNKTPSPQAWSGASTLEEERSVMLSPLSL